MRGTYRRSSPTRTGSPKPARSRKMRLFGIIGSVLLVLSATGSRALGQQLTFTTIDVPGAAYTSAHGINGAGQIVGVGPAPGGLTGVCFDVFYCSDSIISPDCQGAPTPPIVHAGCGPDVDSTFCRIDDYSSGYCVYNDVGNSHGFLRSADGGSLTTIDVPGASDTLATGINDAGQIVGSFADGTGTHAFLRSADGSSFATIDVPGARDTYGAGINDAGRIVGWSFDTTRFHGFLLSDGSFATFDVPGADSTEAHGINATGQIVGTFQDSSFYTHGFLRDADGSFTTIDVPGAIADNFDLSGINTTGQIVGWFLDATGLHGFLRNTDGTFTTIDGPSAPGNTRVNGINDVGQIVGSFDVHGFQAMPMY